MRRSKAEIYLHFVWAVKNRMPFLADDIERAVYRCLQNEATRLGCAVLALGGTETHVHMVVKMPRDVCAAILMKQVKGVTSRFIHDSLPGHEALYWQEGYGVFSITPNHVNAVVQYVRNQKRHHTDSSLHARWEEIDEESQPTPSELDSSANPDGV